MNHIKQTDLKKKRKEEDVKAVTTLWIMNAPHTGATQRVDGGVAQQHSKDKELHCAFEA